MNDYCITVSCFRILHVLIYSILITKLQVLFFFCFGDEEQVNNLPKSKKLKKSGIRILIIVFW